VVLTDAGYGVDQLHCDQFQRHICVTEWATLAPCLCLYWLTGGNIHTYVTTQNSTEALSVHSKKVNLQAYP